jgi:ComF family protein
LIGALKFRNAYAAATPLSELLNDTIDQLPADTIVVPVPTVTSHIRERGYDHTRLIAGRFARQRRLQMHSVITRNGSARQRGANRSQRIAQAKGAFSVTGNINPAATYLLIDDVMTTGATIKYAAEALHQAGATQIWVAIIARQPLD